MSRPTILVADDQVAPRRVTCASLDQLPGGSPAIIEAENGSDAVRLATAIRPDVIIMDWEMPVMDGPEATRRLAEDPRTREIPVLMVTAVRQTPESLQAALEAGACDFIQRPVNPVELITRVRSALRLSRSLQLLARRNQELEESNNELFAALEEVRTLSDYLARCSHCRRVRDDDGRWAASKLTSGPTRSPNSATSSAPSL